MISYIRWAHNINYTYYITCFIMLFILPIIPIVISCIIGLITSNISSKFKYKNATQIIISMLILIGILYISFNMDTIFTYIEKHATSMNDLITKIYYPAGVFAKLITKFNILDLITFILVNIIIFILSIFILSKFYFKINSKLKSITTTYNKKINIDTLKIKSNPQTISLIKKEINTFFKIPVFIINAGFALVLFIVAIIIILIKFDSLINILTTNEIGLGLTKESILNNISIYILILISITSYTTSITNSVISLEGKNINILKSLPIKVKTILMSKVLSALTITTPVLIIGNILLFIKFKINIFNSLLLLILSILIPLVSHFIGIIVNLKYPKFDFENSAEVVKQSASSFIALMINMILLIISFIITTNIIDIINSSLILLLSTIVYIIIDILLYLYLINIGVKEFNKLTI